MGNARRTFGAWLVDVLCGLLAFTIAWAVRFGVGEEFRQELPRAIITFASIYVALKLAWRLYSVQKEHARQTVAVQKAAADIARKSAPPPSVSTPPPPPPPSSSSHRSPGP